MTIPDIKSRLPILEVLNHYGYKPSANGSMICPFHEPKQGTKKKTFQIYTDTNRYQCFNKDCSSGNGDVIDFIEKKEGCSKHQAIEKAKTLIAGNPVNSDAHSDDILRSNAKEDAFPRVRGEVGSHPGEQQAMPEAMPTAGRFPEGGTFKVLSPEQYRYQDQNLKITVLGGVRLDGLDRMRTTLKIEKSEAYSQVLRHTLDLYHDDQVQKLIRKAAERLETGTSKTEKSLTNLTSHLESYRLEELAKAEDPKPKTTALTKEERAAAITFLKTENLMSQTNELLGHSGIVGEEMNRQILWLVYSSRKRPKPLHVICLGASGTGKTYLQDMVSRFIPESEKFTFTASTENAFYYLDKYDLCQKLVLIEDMDGVQYLLYPLRELQTKSWISKVVPLKDSKGNMKAQKLEVYGPICLSGTTTKERLYEDNANRCLLLHLDNSPEQQENIMAYQRSISAGRIDHNTEEEATRLLQNVQRVLEPVKVINPYAESLKLPASCFKPLRTNQHYLQFIETVTWYHQYQRTEKADDNGEVYISTTLEDIKLANYLLKDILLTKSDELPKAIRTFFEQVKAWLTNASQSSFYSKALRTHFRLYPMKANRYIKTLESYGYLKRAGGNKKQGYEYEVADWSEYDKLKNGLDVMDQLLEKLEKHEKVVEA